MKPIEINPDHRRSPLRGLSGAVLVADDHDIVRFGLVQLLRANAHDF